MYLLIGSGQISLDVHWHINESIIVVTGFENIVQVGHEVVSLLDKLERGQEAVGGSGSISLRIFLEGDNPSVEEGNDVVPVKDFALHIHPFLWLVILGILGLGKGVEAAHDVVKTDRLGVGDHLVGVATTALIDNGFVVEFL